ncbi:hypothetical protein RJI07_00005 [Mycoplasmatota bacterium WC30]
MKIKRVLMFLVIFSFVFVLAACNEDTSETTTATTVTTATTATTEVTTEVTTEEVTTTEAATTTETTTVIQSQTLSILDGWVDSGDSVYTITQSETELSVTYDKNSFSWANMVYTIDQDLSAYNKLVLTISGSGTMLVKIQGATEAFEVSIQLTAGAVTYQLNLRDYDDFLGGVTGVFIFAGPGKVSDTGNYTITNFSFDEGTAYGTVLENGDNNIPQNEQEYDGTGETFDFSAGFVDNGDGVYDIDKSGDNPIVTYTKAAGFEWAYMISTVKGDFSDFDYVVLTLKGITAGSVMLKAELSATVQAELEGTFEVDEEITLCLDLSTWTDEQLDALTKVIVFGAPGSATGTGEFEVLDAYFSKVFVGEIVEVPEWVGVGMDVVIDGTSVTATYTDTPAEWWNVNIQKALTEFDGTKESIIFTFTGVLDQTYVFKIEGGGQAVEGTPVTATGASQEFILDLSGLTEVQRDGLNKIVVFATTEAASGTLVVDGWEYVMPEWIGVGMDVVIDGTSVTATYADIPAEWWNVNVQSPIAVFDGTKESIIFTFTGEAGQEYKFKVEGGGAAVEGDAVLATGASQEVILDLSSLTEVQRDGLNLVVVFVTTEAASGTLVVEGWEYVIPEAPEWIGDGMDVVVSETEVTITYTDTPAEWWNANAQSILASFDATKDSIIFTFIGETGQEYKFKVEGGGAAIEGVSVVATGASQEYILDFSSLTLAQKEGLNKLVIFSTTVGASGTLVLEGWEYVTPEAPAWVGVGMDIVIDGTSVTATYTDTPAEWWNVNIQSPVTAFDGTLEAITFTFTGVLDQTYVFKIEGGGQAVEGTPVTATGASQEFILDLSGLTEVQRNGLNKIVIFATTEAASGTLVVEGWDYVIPEAPAWVGVGMDIVIDGMSVTATYTDTPAEWWNVNIQSPIAAFDGTKEGVIFTFTGVLDQTYVFKIEGGGQAVEGTPVTATGASQEFTLDLSGLTEVQRNGLNKIVIFATTELSSGTLLVEGWEYVIPEAPAWIGDGMDVVVVSETEVTITYTDTPEQWWNANAQSMLDSFDATKDSIIFTFTGVVGHEYKFKVEGGGAAVEGVSVVATGALQEFVLNFSSLTLAEKEGLNKLVIFSTTVGASGTLVLEGWEYVIPEWIGVGMDIVVDGSSVTATYTDTPAEWWNVNIQSPIAAFDGTKEGVIFTFTGVLDQTYVFKIEAVDKLLKELLLQQQVLHKNSHLI